MFSFHKIPYSIPLDRNSNVILPMEEKKGALILGDFVAALNEKNLQKRGIFSVLTVAFNLFISYKTEAISHKILPAEDCEEYDLSVYFEESFNFIENALEKGSVLVHCAAGMSRSATIVIAYLMKKNRWNVDEAFDFVKKRRKIISPNAGFMRQLRIYQKDLNI